MGIWDFWYILTGRFLKNIIKHFKYELKFENILTGVRVRNIVYYVPTGVRQRTLLLLPQRAGNFQNHTRNANSENCYFR